MRYCNIIAIKTFACCILMLFLDGAVHAQQNTDSPYSRYGIGLIRQSAFNSSFATGGIGQAWRPLMYKPQINDSLARSNAKLNDRQTNYLNLTNPAAISNISLTTYEVSLLSQNVEYTSDSQSRQGNNTTLNHFAIGFPVGNQMGMSFGIRPYSVMGFDYQTINSVQSVSNTKSYEGRGGLNEIFFASAYQFEDYLSIGLKGKYLFGNMQETKRVIFTESYFFNTIDRSEMAISSMAFEIGIQYFKSLNKDYRMVVGATLSPVDEVSGKRTNLIATYTGTNNLERIKDTLELNSNQKIELTIPSSIAGGWSIEKKGKWLAGIDYTQINWTSTPSIDGVTFENAYQINAGFEKFSQIAAFGGYLKRMGYRFGIRYNSALLHVNNTAISELGIATGIALPLRKSFSTINFGIELGRRGTTDDGLTQEDFINLHFGMTINDKWFIKRKYD